MAWSAKTLLSKGINEMIELGPMFPSLETRADDTAFKRTHSYFSKCRGRCFSQGNQCRTLSCVNIGMKVVRVDLFIRHVSCQVHCRNFESSSNCKKMLKFMLCRHTFFNHVLYNECSSIGTHLNF